MLALAGIPQGERNSAHAIIMAEGHYDPCVINGGAHDCTYPTKPGATKAYGVCQAKPGIKMASAGADWQTNPVTQLKWCNQYANTAYAGWDDAKSAWAKKKWW